MRKFRKSLILLYVLTVLMTSNEVWAQGGMFQRGANDNTINERAGLLNGNREGQAINGDISNQTFETPLNGGAVFLIAASLGYALFKRKEEKV